MDQPNNNRYSSMPRCQGRRWGHDPMAQLSPKITINLPGSIQDLVVSEGLKDNSSR